HVNGTVVGGNGGATFDAGKGGNGASEILTNAIGASTSGGSYLTQSATGGDGGGGAIPGIAGDATSSLSKSTSNLNNTVISFATGGRGGNRNNFSGTPAAGGTSNANATATNSAGAASAQAEGDGGWGGD